MFKIAFRNLFLHKVKTAIIGSIIVFGTTLAIVGNSFVDAISGGMQRSLTESVTGDIQVYASDAKEKISVLGNMDGTMPDIGHVNDFGKLRDTLMAKVPNIKSMIPMGTNLAFVSPGNILDVKLEELRSLYRAKPRDSARIERVKDHVHAIVEDIQRKLQESQASVNLILARDEFFAKAPENLRKALAPGFWATFDANAEERIEFMANVLAPLIFDDNMLFLSYIGTFPERFRQEFSQFEVVKGTDIPDGKRGFLFSDYFYETFIKHRVARRLDQIKKHIEKNKLPIATSKELQDLVSANVSQAAEVYTQMSPHDTRALLPKLQSHLNSKEGDISKLTQEFLKTTDENFMARYRFFYDEIAPHVILYKFRVGDIFPITAFSKTGYSRSVNMKVYGTYRFKSFESSPIAGNFNIMDMISFRELYGFMTEEKRQETQALETEMAIRDIGKDDIEAMFSSGGGAGVKVVTGGTRLTAPTAFGKFEQRRRAFEVEYSDSEMENGVFLSSAVVLKDRKRIAETIREIEAVSKADNLGIQATDWRSAAGMVGNLAMMVRALLYFLVIITFGIATFVIMNSMLMATLERTREIGTMRAIGARRSFILKLFLQETAILSFIFGAIGTLIGVTIILTVGAKGIPAMGDPTKGDVSTFFFSGDRLYLSLNPTHIIIVFICMTLVAVISTQYPAWRAMRISPLEAIENKD